MKAVLFDLDMTLVNSAALADARAHQAWSVVRANMDAIAPFSFTTLDVHTIPATLGAKGILTGIVTSSPKWYAQEVIERFEIDVDVLLTGSDGFPRKPAPDGLKEALGVLGVDPRDSCYVGDDANDVIASWRAGMLSVGAGWGIVDGDALASFAPDILLHEPSYLLNLAHLRELSYVGERLTAGIASRLHDGSLIRLQQGYAAGRYFNASDVRHAGSSLSGAVLALKNGDVPAQSLGAVVATLVGQIDFKPSYVVPVPPKPGEERLRFDKVLQVANEALGGSMNVVSNGLTRTRDVPGYKAMGPIQRANAIKGIYHTGYNWTGHSVLLIDDVLTTGTTANECARVLRASGATDVRVLALAKDQKRFEGKTCICGRPMVTRPNRTTGVQFWGCSGYRERLCNHTESIDD